MTAKEEDILTNQNYIKKGIVLDKLIESLIVDKDVSIDNLLLGDKNAILLYRFALIFVNISIAISKIVEIKREIKSLFHKYDFSIWRETSLTDFLKEKRAWEKEHRRYARPYLDYLNIETH